jgi:hypothetical protein
LFHACECVHFETYEFAYAAASLLLDPYALGLGGWLIRGVNLDLAIAEVDSYPAFAFTCYLLRQFIAKIVLLTE